LPIFLFVVLIGLKAIAKSGASRSGEACHCVCCGADPCGTAQRQGARSWSVSWLL